MTHPFTTTDNAAAILRHITVQPPADDVTTPKPADTNPQPPTPKDSQGPPVKA